MSAVVERVVDRARKIVLDDFSPAGPSVATTASGSSSGSAGSTSRDSNGDDGNSPSGAGLAPAAAPPPVHHGPAQAAVLRLSDWPPRPAAPARPGPLGLLNHILNLPPELQLEILSHLHYGDLERLRRTSRLFRAALSPAVLRSLLPDLPDSLLSTCALCLAHQPDRLRMLARAAPDDDHQDPGLSLVATPTALRNRCFRCVALRGGFVPGERCALGDGATSAVPCRWCGLPVRTELDVSYEQFHGACYRPYGHATTLYVVAGCAQGAAVVTAAVLCWVYFRGDVRVLAPSIVGFVAAIWAGLLLFFRSNYLRTYHWSLLVEVVVAALWIPPAYAIVGYKDQRPKEARATLALIGVNLVFRLLNIIGNAILMAEYQMWRRRQKRDFVPPARRILNQLVGVFVFWTYPGAIEQVHAPNWVPRRSEYY